MVMPKNFTFSFLHCFDYKAELILRITVHYVGLTETGITRCVTADTSLHKVDAYSGEILMLQ